MSQRLGMSDGRCFTINTASGLLNDHIMQLNNIRFEDNYAYRNYLQKMGPSALKQIEAVQGKETGKNFANQCMACNKPLLKVPHTY